MNKVLISRGFGAGWSTWASGDMAKFIARYTPIIEFLERGGVFKESGRRYSAKNHEDPWMDYEEPGRELLRQMCEECQEKFGDMPYLGGVDGLTVKYAEEGSPVYEYDGNESLTPFGGGTYV